MLEYCTWYWTTAGKGQFQNFRHLMNDTGNTKCTQHTVTIIAHSLPLLIRVIQHTTSSPLSSHTQLTRTSSSPIQGGHLHSICHLFLSFLLLKSNESDGGSISTVFLGSLHTNSDCKPNPQKHWTLHLDIYSGH